MIYTATGTLIELAPTPFAKGGEGQLYHVQHPSTWQDCVAKVYYTNKRTTERARKLTYLVQNPLHIKQKKAASLVAWPLELLYEEEKFIGFLMPMASGELLEVLAAPKLPKRLSKNNRWKRFDFRQPTAFALRQKVCFNIAVALQQIHATGKYVMVDFKPENILLQPNGLVSLVDIDSIQIVEDGKQLFSAAVATPEFAPPEFHHDSRSLKHSSWDEFSLAIIFYKILLGIHPFAATAKGEYEQAITLGEKIAAGLYVQNTALQTVFSSIPPPHQAFDLLDSKLKHLFNSCFLAGPDENSLRPSAEDWCLALGGNQMTRPYFELPTRQFDLQLPNLTDGSYGNSFEEYWNHLPIIELDALIQKRHQRKHEDQLILVLLIGVVVCGMACLINAFAFFVTFLFFFWIMRRMHHSNHLLEYQSEKWWDFHNRIKPEQQQQFLLDREKWQREQDLQQKWQEQQQQKWEQIWLTAEKECLKLNQEKLAELTDLQLTRNSTTIWQKYEGKNLFQKLAYLEQQHLPDALATIALDKKNAIKTVEQQYQQEWEVLEQGYHQHLKQIEKKYAHDNPNKINQKKKAETDFLKQRQTIIEAIATAKTALEEDYLQQKNMLQESIQRDKNTLKEIANHYKQQQQWLTLHYQSKFRNLLARLEVDFHQVQTALLSKI